MNKTKEIKDLIFYYKNLPRAKQLDFLDLIKWHSVENYTLEELNKIQKLSKEKGKTFDAWKKAKKHLNSLKKK